MPMFYIPKPRQFTYRPRFYDPEKERWEALKQKYADERALEELRATPSPTLPETTVTAEGATDDELAYFERRVREFDREERRGSRKLTWKDLFRKREMPKFEYKPRFSSDAQEPVSARADTPNERVREFKRRTTKIKRRYDIADKDYMKPVPASRIMLYTLLVCMLIYWIVF